MLLGGEFTNTGTVNNTQVSNGEFTNMGNVANGATVSGGAFVNEGGSVTGETSVRGGSFSNNAGGYVADAEVYGSGTLVNRAGIVDGTVVRSQIDDVTVWGGGTFTNLGGEVGNTTTLRSGAEAAGSPVMMSFNAVTPASNDNVIENFGGHMRGMTTIDTGDRLYNANLDLGGFLLTGEIDNLRMHGGTFNNEASVGNMTYWGGSVNGTNGSINALTIAGYSNGSNDFGSVSSLAFSTDGNGFMTINGFVGDDGGLTFTPNIQANTVNLSHANLMLDFSSVIGSDYLGFDAWTEDFASTFANGLGTFSGWGASWGDLFGIADNLVDGWEAINMINVGWGDDLWATIWQDGGVTHQMWDANGWGISGDAAVPEPATLAILGLGLAGLGLARARQKRKTLAA
jgi:hypothetical protein